MIKGSLLKTQIPREQQRNPDRITEEKGDKRGQLGVNRRVVSPVKPHTVTCLRVKPVYMYTKWN